MGETGLKLPVANHSTALSAERFYLIELSAAFRRSATRARALSRLPFQLSLEFFGVSCVGGIPTRLSAFTDDFGPTFWSIVASPLGTLLPAT